ncbi:MAG: hypothetical protein LBE34_04965 [Flavobacteriaceae bacterium]|jgi:hypothetical protein|nr:hypothetical protein [Flavobacteriaceae bacterium]
MRKIITLFLALSLLSTVHAQRKFELPKAEKAKIEYVELQQILDHKSDLNLTNLQVQSITVKNEYLKRELQSLNNQKNADRIERRMYERELSASQKLFIERQLTADQLEKWQNIKAQIAQDYADKTTLKDDLAILEHQYKLDLADLQVRYSADRDMFKIQKNNLNQYYAKKVGKLKQYYEAKAAKNGEDEEYVPTLEDIANLVKDFDEQTNNSSPLNNIRIEKETPETTEN